MVRLAEICYTLGSEITKGLTQLNDPRHCLVIAMPEVEKRGEEKRIEETEKDEKSDTSAFALDTIIDYVLVGGLQGVARRSFPIR